MAFYFGLAIKTTENLEKQSYTADFSDGENNSEIIDFRKVMKQFFINNGIKLSFSA